MSQLRASPLTIPDAGSECGDEVGFLGETGSVPQVRTGVSPGNASNPYKVTEKELEDAFAFFSGGEKDEDGNEIVTLEALKTKLGAFYENVPSREYKFLLKGMESMTLAQLKKIVSSSMLSTFDPSAEAFKVYDPDETGYVDTEILKGIFKKLDFGDITNEDLKVLVETADVDNDGKISIADFRDMLTSGKEESSDDKDAKEQE